MNNYIYQIVNLETHEYYIGKRVGKGNDPYKDIYWGSGSNKVCRGAKKHNGMGYRKMVCDARKKIS